ncbi:MAG: peptidoglycan bridge formation glycyltransferase FemA/FemB family protein [Sedimentisphaerales bacterium]|nr:peptidoglycan bridge formation glycyltransferase FemA/FemB family protein [Sedimentisphaerales bacterium]
MPVTLKPIDRDAWQQLAPLFKDYNYRQLWDFGIACANRLDAVSEHMAVYEGAEIAGMMDVRIKLVPFFKTGIAYITGGPLIRRGREDDRDRLRTCLNALVNQYVHTKGLLLRIKPTIGMESWNSMIHDTFRDCGFSISKTIKPYRTLLLDMDRSLDDIRKNLSQKWRNNLKRSEAGTQPIESDCSVESLVRFSGLYDTFRENKQFDVELDPKFYIEVQRMLSESERMVVALCEHDGVLISGHVSSLLGDTAVNLFRANTKAALSSRVSYRIQWNGVLRAHEQGCQWYDLGGIDPDNNPGVYSFKKGMGGEDITVPGPFEYYPDGFKRILVTSGEKAFKFAKRFQA